MITKTPAIRLVMTLFFLAISAISLSQELADDKRLRLEIEPGLFFNNGRSVNGLYTVTNDRNFAIGIYMMATDIPKEIAKNMFNNLADSTHLRVTKEFAFNFRYRIRLSKRFESNPYVGLILAWEDIKLTHTTQDDLGMSTFIVTPHVGYEFYLYKKMLYVNPQIRSAIYFGQTKTDDARPESLKSFLILPSISFGLRL